jgi:phosphate transport system substrate-binding protein
MKLKSPVRLNRKPGWLSHPRSRLKTLMAVGTAVVGFAGLAVAQAGPAAADPTEVFVATGSDTTMDIMNQYSNDIGSNELGSYDAINPVTAVAHEIITPVKNTGTLKCSFTRPNGSGEGLAALRKSINPSTTATQLPAPPQQNCIDIGRSSAAPGTNASTTGGLVYIPYALDGVTGAVGPTGTTAITTANMFTIADLQALYVSCTTATEGGVTYNPGTPAAGQVKIDLYVPQSGSGTRNFWASKLGFSSTTLPACVHDTIQAGPNLGLSVEEHNGTAVATDPNGYMPFSIAQWISQRNGHNDRRHGAVLANINGISPFDNGNPASGNLNTAFPITREVYNIVLFSSVDPTSATKNPALISLLVGATSSLCQDAFTITGYGFAQLGATTTDQCGSIASTLRAFDPVTNPI